DEDDRARDLAMCVHPPRVRNRHRLIVLILAAVTSACTTSSSTGMAHPSPTDVTGTILAITEPGGSSPAVAMRLPGEIVSPVSSPARIPTATYTVTHASA